MGFVKKMEAAQIHILKGSTFLFSDERYKKKLLDLIFEQYRRNKWSLLAFCVTDSMVYLLSVTNKGLTIREKLRETADEFLKWTSSEESLWYGNSKEIKVIEAEKLLALDDIVNCCCCIHYVPVHMGYTTEMCDYWWSSYNTYMGSYIWETVDCHAVFFYFSMNSIWARDKLRKYHGSLKFPVLYKTYLNGKYDAKMIKK